MNETVRTVSLVKQRVFNKRIVTKTASQLERDAKTTKSNRKQA